MLLSLPRSALSISFSDRHFSSVVLSRLRHFHSQESRIAELKPNSRPTRTPPQRANDLGRHGARKRRRNGISNLPSPMPFGDVESEPIGKTVKACHFPYGDTPRVRVMDGARTSKRPAGGIGSCSQCVAEACCGKLVKTRNGLYIAGYCGVEPTFRDFSVFGSET
jgi:hypothetical protein